MITKKRSARNAKAGGEAITRARAGDILEAGRPRELRALAEKLLDRDIGLYWDASLAAVKLGRRYTQGLYRRALATNDNWTSPRIETLGSAIEDDVRAGPTPSWTRFLSSCLAGETRPRVAGWIVWTLLASTPIAKGKVHVVDAFAGTLVSALERIEDPRFRAEVARAVEYMTGKKFFVEMDRFFSSLPGPMRSRFATLKKAVAARAKAP